MIKWIKRIINKSELYTLYIHFGDQITSIPLFELKLKSKNIAFINGCLTSEDKTVREMMLVMLHGQFPEGCFEKEIYNINYLKMINNTISRFSLQKY
jgi:hypothetical protein